MKKISGKFKLINIFYRFKWAWLELTTSFALTLILLLFGKPIDDNISQVDLDKKAFRSKYYPTLALTLVSMIIIFINFGLFLTTQIPLFNLHNQGSKALTTFVVNSVADDADFLVGDGFCDTDDSAGDGPCTFRAAIQEGNVAVDDVAITFNIPGAGVHTIMPVPYLPEITRSLLIDGSTQPGSDCSTQDLKIEIDGDLGTGNGLSIHDGNNINTTIKGLVINNYLMSGVSVYNNTGNNTVNLACNIIGLDTDGSTLQPNQVGIATSGATTNTIIGGISTSDRNIISGNTFGIEINTTNVQIIGNYIGTDISGLLDKGNTDYNIRMPENVATGTAIIGGSTTNHRNIIAGSQNGIALNGSGHTIQNNYIGLGANGTTVIANDTGIEIYDTSHDITINSNVISTINGTGINALGSGTFNLSNLIFTNNLIGTDSSGNVIVGNNTGINIYTPAIQDPEMQEAPIGITIDGNTISGNSTGITIVDHAGGSGIAITNNRIGIADDSVIDLGNSNGIFYSGYGGQIGTVNAGNLFGYNSVAVHLDGDTDTNVLNNQFINNSTGIETDAQNSLISGNNFENNTTALTTRGASHNNEINSNEFLENVYNLTLIDSNSNDIANNNFCGTNGGTTSITGSDNIITNNKFSLTNHTALEIGTPASNNALVGNAYSDSNLISIDLTPLGSTANDAGDIDTGPNNLQNYPSDIALVGEDITFNLDTNAGNYHIEFHIPDSGSCSELSSLMCSGGIDHAGGTQSYTLYCPGLPVGDFDLNGLAILEPTPFVYTDTSEFSPIVTLNNPGPTNTPTPTETPIPTATNTPIPTSTNTPVPSATATPVPTPTIIVQNTPSTSLSPTTRPNSTTTVVSSTTPSDSVAPEDTVMPTQDYETATGSPSPSGIIDGSDISPTPVGFTGDSSSDSQNDSNYQYSKYSYVNNPLVKTIAVNMSNQIDKLTKNPSPMGTIINTSLGISARIKPLSDNVSYLLSLQFVGSKIALAGVSSVNLLALAAPAIVTAFSQPKILFYALAWFWKRRNSTPWGVVLDKKTNIPIAFARLVLVKDGKTISTQTTDLQGKYGFTANKGIYKIFISHSEYIDDSFEVTLNYDGEIISKDFELVSKTHDDLSTELGWSVYRVKKFLRSNLFVFNTIMFSMGFVYTLFAITNAFTVLNYIILSLYLLQIVLIVIFYFTRDRNLGQVIDISSGEPVKGAVIRIYDNERQLDVTISDNQGRYVLLLEPGTYFIQVNAAGYVFPVGESDNILHNKVGEKVLKFTSEDKQRINLKLYMQKYANVSLNRPAILSPFS